jgi:threonine dehydratase
LPPSWRWAPGAHRRRGQHHATTYADSLAAGRVVEAPVSTLLADGMAVRVADADALAVLTQHLDHIVQVSDAEVAQAMRDLFTDTHNVAEGAGAASFAAAMQERASLKGPGGRHHAVRRQRGCERVRPGAVGHFPARPGHRLL